MRLRALALGVGLLACGGDPIGPSSLDPSYSLLSIDGEFLPAPDSEVPDGAVVVSADLQFPRAGRSREGGPTLVAYTRRIRLADQTEQLVTIELSYQVRDGELRINLCPPLAFCLVPTELVGPADRFELVLTHVLANIPRSVYRFTAVLLE